MKKSFIKGCAALAALSAFSLNVFAGPNIKDTYLQDQAMIVLKSQSFDHVGTKLNSRSIPSIAPHVVETSPILYMSLPHDLKDDQAVLAALDRGLTKVCQNPNGNAWLIANTNLKDSNWVAKNTKGDKREAAIVGLLETCVNKKPQMHTIQAISTFYPHLTNYLKPTNTKDGGAFVYKAPETTIVAMVRK